MCKKTDCDDFFSRENLIPDIPCLVYLVIYYSLYGRNKRNYAARKEDETNSCFRKSYF